MANAKISSLTGATTPLGGTEVLPIVQSGTTVKASIANVQTATYSAGTANGVAYLNGSKVLTTGSALVFDGTNLGVGVSPSAWNLGNAVEVGYAGNTIWGAGSSNFLMGANMYYNGGYKYAASATNSSYYQQYQGSHYWTTAASGTAGGTITFTTAMTLDTSGGLKVLNTIGVGNAAPSTSGAGITFPATQSASSDANTLDDYEEGTWTATLTGSTTAPTVPVTSTTAVYTKIGRSVELNFNFDNVSVVGATGDAKITGVPFACGSTAGHGVVGVGNFGASVLCASILGSASQITLRNSLTTGFAPITSGTVGIYILCQLTYSV